MDLTFIEEGSAQNHDGFLINWHKKKLISGSMRTIFQYQLIPYNLAPVNEIQQMLDMMLEAPLISQIEVDCIADESL
jgi:hypothetical protein